MSDDTFWTKKIAILIDLEFFWNEFELQAKDWSPIWKITNPWDKLAYWHDTFIPCKIKILESQACKPSVSWTIQIKWWVLIQKWRYHFCYNPRGETSCFLLLFDSHDNNSYVNTFVVENIWYQHSVKFLYSERFIHGRIDIMNFFKSLIVNS